MPIITLFDGTFGDGEKVAREVARMLDYPLVGREVLVATAQRCQVPEARLSDLLEKEPRWWERWRENSRSYRVALQAAMTEAAKAEDLVYYGHIGHALLPGIDHVLRVLLIAPTAHRIARVCEQHGFDLEAARHYVERVEKARGRRLKALFGFDWRDPGQYDLVISLRETRLDAVRGLIVQSAKSTDLQPTAQSRQRLADLALTAKVESHILTLPHLSRANIQVRAERGIVRLSGIVASTVSEDELRRAVGRLPGVEAVAIDLMSIFSEELGHG